MVCSKSTITTLFHFYFPVNLSNKKYSKMHNRWIEVATTQPISVPAIQGELKIIFCIMWHSILYINNYPNLYF